MAGYGTSVRVPVEFDGLVSALLSAAQRRGTPLDLRVRFARNPSVSQWRHLELRSWELAVDGRGWRIAAWAHQLERDLPVVAEGWTGPSAGRRAVRVAESFVARWIDWCVGADDFVDDRVRISARDINRWRWPIFDLPEPYEGNERVWLADEVCSRWVTGDIPDEIMIEELHTAIEQVLRRALSPGKRANFPTLLDAAEQEGLLGEDGKSVLKHLSREWRNALKHRGKTIADRDALRRELFAAVDVFDLLLGKLNRR